MATMQRHCARRARSCFPCTAAAHHPSSARSQSIHTTGRWLASEDGNEKAKTARPQVRSVLRNQATFNAINTPTPNDVKGTINKFVGGKPQNRSRDGQTGGLDNRGAVTDARKLGTAGNAAGAGPLLARRRGVPAGRAGGASTRDGNRSFGPRSGGGGARGGSRGGDDDGYVGAPRSRGKARRGGRGGRRGGRYSNTEDLDEIDDSELDFAATIRDEASMSTEGNPEEWFLRDMDADVAAEEAREKLDDTELGYAASGLVQDIRNPVAAIEDIESANLSPEAKEWAMSKVREKHAPVPYEPEFDPVKDLAGFGPGLNIGNGDELDANMSADTLYQALGQSTHYHGKASNKRTLEQLARRFARWDGDDTTVMMPLPGSAVSSTVESAADSKAALEDFTRQVIERRRADTSPHRREAIDHVMLDEIAPDEAVEFHSPTPAARKAVNDYLIAGKYTPPGQLAPNNASATIKEVYRMLARNSTYNDGDGQKLATKIASMLPVARPGPAKPAAKKGSAGAGAGAQAKVNATAPKATA